MVRKNAVETTAKQWADIHNEKIIERDLWAESNISNLSFENRGIIGVPQMREGPASCALIRRGQKAATRKEWKRIDTEKNRCEANTIIRQVKITNRLGSLERAQKAREAPTAGRGSKRPWASQRCL